MLWQRVLCRAVAVDHRRLARACDRKPVAKWLVCLRLRTYIASNNTPSCPGAAGAHTHADTNVLWQRTGFPLASCGCVLVHVAIRHICLQPHCSAVEQVSLPVAEVDGCPLGLGIIGPRGSDEDLLQLSASLMKLMRPMPSGDAAKQA